MAATTYLYGVGRRRRSVMDKAKDQIKSFPSQYLPKGVRGCLLCLGPVWNIIIRVSFVSRNSTGLTKLKGRLTLSLRV